MKVAVVGGGVFGCTIAVDLAQAGATVDLFEAQADILTGATDRCQARLHRGYHYPRSDSTAAAARDAYDTFMQRYPLAVFSRQHHYLIASDSKVSPADYLAFCDRLGLPYELIDRPMQVLKEVEAVVRVPEAFVNVDILRQVIRGDMYREKVRTHFGLPINPTWLGAEYDLVVWATYGQPWCKPLRYEICEVAHIELGRYNDESFVVMDGDYISLDPHRGHYALYDVKHSVHHSNVGMAPEIPYEYRDLVAASGPRRTPLSHVDEMLESASRFLWGLDPGGLGVTIYRGSRFSVRAVLPNVDATDERPTLIERDGNQIRVLSGKICTAVTAATEVVALVTGANVPGLVPEPHHTPDPAREPQHTGHH